VKIEPAKKGAPLELGPQSCLFAGLRNIGPVVQPCCVSIFRAGNLAFSPFHPLSSNISHICATQHWSIDLNAACKDRFIHSQL